MAVQIALEKWVDTLEDYMKELAHQVWRTEIAVQSLAEEMKDFKDEMRNDLKARKKAMQEDLKAHGEEVGKDMKAYKEERRRERRDMNKQWGNLANKMGTLVADIVAPAVRPVLRKYFNVHVEHFAIKASMHLKDSDLKGEYDALAVEGRMPAP